MRLAILGGTFNPPHIGHLILAQEVQCQLGYDTVLFVPAAIPAHKRAPDPSRGDASPEDRLSMLRRAVDGVPGFLVDDCEIARGGVSYTIDTISHVLGRYAASGKPGLVIGDDLLDGFPAWREATAIAERAEIIVAHRAYAEERVFPYAHIYCNNALVSISSSAIRDRARLRLPLRFLVPDAVALMIEERGLYR